MAEQPGWRTYLVEHYSPGITEPEFRRSAERVAASAQRLAASGEPIRFLHSTLVLEDEAAYCVLAAASDGLVRHAYAGARVSFERLVEAVESDALDGHVPIRHVPIRADAEHHRPASPEERPS